MACGGSGGGSEASQPELINGIAVPPVPEQSANDSTIAGVDSNSNGIRDDVERRLATEFGADPVALPIARAHAQRLQSLLVSPSAATKSAYVEQSRCISDRSLLRRLGAQTSVTLNTAERQQAYRAALTNVFINRDGC